MVAFVKPLAVLRVVDGAGNVLVENYEEKVRVLSDDVAYKMIFLLKGPTEYGTARGASGFGIRWPVRQEPRAITTMPSLSGIHPT